MRGKILFILLGIILVISFVSANFEIGDPSHLIEKQYSSLDNIKGWINISLEEEPVDSLFEDDFGNSISLIDLLETNPDAVYSCEPTNCLPGYSANNGQQEKTFILNSGEKKTMGFKFTGNIDSINPVTFNVESNAIESCSNQLKVDILKNNTIDIGNNKASSSSCPLSKSYGCFDNSGVLSPGILSSIPFCQKIELPESPGFKLGAWVKEETAGDAVLSMALYDINGLDLEKSCVLPPVIIPSGEEIYCEVDYLTLKSEEHYVCISSDGGSGEYEIQGHAKSNGCGLKGYPGFSLPENSAYNISVEGKKFGDVGTLEISNLLSNGDNFAEMIEDYIETTYSSLDCSSECVVPVEFISGMDSQELTLKELSVNYDLGGGLVGSTDEFYELSEIQSRMGSTFQIINLDEGNFSVPPDYGENTFELSLGGVEIFSEEIIIKSAPLIKNLKPKITAAAIPTEFKVLVDSYNIDEYEWDFGDGINDTTAVNKITHTYDEIGVYDLKITITANNQISSSKTFKIDVISPKQAINTTLKKKLDDLSNIDLQIKQFKFEQNLKSVLNFSTLENDLNKIQQDYKNAGGSESKYKTIIISLLGIEVPESVNIAESAELITFYPKKDNIDLNVIKEITGGDYDTEHNDEYVDALLFWNQNNMDTKVTFSEFVASYGYFDERPILKTFEFQINKKNNSDDSYLIIAKLEGIEFEGNYSEKEESEYLYVKLEQDSETIIFTTTADVNFVDVPAFISPKLEKLKIAEGIEIGEEDKSSKWIFFIFILLFLILAGVGVYVILQEWYKRKYESYLFKKRNDLYNLMIYVTGERKKGSPDKEIYSKLKKSGWGSEQVNYILKKHAGKRTGMFEIISLGKKKTEVQQKQNTSKSKVLFS